MNPKLNRYTETNLKKYVGKTVKIVWLDIFGEQQVSKSEMENSPLVEQLVKNDSFGKVGKVNSGCLELLHEESSIDVTRTVMPIAVIDSIKELK